MLSFKENISVEEKIDKAKKLMEEMKILELQEEKLLNLSDQGRGCNQIGDACNTCDYYMDSCSTEVCCENDW